MSRKLYHLQSHLAITISDAQTGICKIGLSDYALNFFLRFHKMQVSDYPKTKYGMSYVSSINIFIKETFKKYEEDKLIRQKLKIQGQEITQPHLEESSLTFSEKMQYDRFLIRKGQGFSLLQTYEYDIELAAPFDMRVIERNHEMYYFNSFLTIPYFFEVQCLNKAQLNNLISEEEYVRAPKFFEYC